MTTLAPESGSSLWHYDWPPTAAEMIADYDSGMERFDAIGIAAGMQISERFSITGDDPLSAKASLAWTIKRERDDWRVRVEAKIELRCTADAFLVRQSLAAFEGDDPRVRAGLGPGNCPRSRLSGGAARVLSSARTASSPPAGPPILVTPISRSMWPSMTRRRPRSLLRACHANSVSTTPAGLRTLRPGATAETDIELRVVSLGAESTPDERRAI